MKGRAWYIICQLIPYSSHMGNMWDISHYFKHNKSCRMCWIYDFAREYLDVGQNFLDILSNILGFVTGSILLA